VSFFLEYKKSLSIGYQIMDSPPAFYYSFAPHPVPIYIYIRYNSTVQHKFGKMEWNGSFPIRPQFLCPRTFVLPQLENASLVWYDYVFWYLIRLLGDASRGQYLSLKIRPLDVTSHGWYVPRITNSSIISLSTVCVGQFIFLCLTNDKTHQPVSSNPSERTPPPPPPKR
jgi:hypothetical protein